jgi:hypothetical protein
LASVAVEQHSIGAIASSVAAVCGWGMDSSWVNPAWPRIASNATTVAGPGETARIVQRDCVQRTR